VYECNKDLTKITNTYPNTSKYMCTQTHTHTHSNATHTYWKIMRKFQKCVCPSTFDIFF